MWKLKNNSNKNMKYNCSRRSFNLKIQQILGSHELKCHCHFCHAHPKIFESTFSFPKFVSACKKSVYSICWVLRYSQFRVQWPDWQQPFFTMLTQKIFDQLLIFVNLYQHAKNQFIPSVNSSDRDNFRVPSLDPSIWSFWWYSQF